MTSRNVIFLSQLKPTQLTVGMLQVQHKRKRMRELLRRPTELVEFILEHPIRVVLGPGGNAYVIDHHHLALALTREKYETAPMDVEGDFSKLKVAAFWQKMATLKYIHPVDARGRAHPVEAIPKSLEGLKDDPYRSLAGFARASGGFVKVETPFAEFLWADYFRERIPARLVKNHFHKALRHALKLCRHPEARGLPGYVGKKKAKSK
jgi:hypothetical protein